MSSIYVTLSQDLMSRLPGGVAFAVACLLSCDIPIVAVQASQGSLPSPAAGDPSRGRGRHWVMAQMQLLQHLSL